MCKSFYAGKVVLVTGHTGFKGTWLCKVLVEQGAHVIGYALEPMESINVFGLSRLAQDMTSIIGDIRDLAHLTKVINQYQPEIVLHLAAQPLVRESYSNPVYTYETNVMGTVNICEAIRVAGCVESFVNITTDKVYYNNEWAWGYREEDVLNGYDPYSNSKSCSELVTSSYLNSFFNSMEIAVSTCRAGNVIGGGDFSKDRIIPDCVRAAAVGQTITVRNPYSIRPYQHVLEPVMAYLMLAQRQYMDKKVAGCYNIGPNDDDCVTTATLVSQFCNAWGPTTKWATSAESAGPHEANFLKLDCSKIKQVLGWKPIWGIGRAVEETVTWSRAYLQGQDVAQMMNEQIANYMRETCW